MSFMLFSKLSQLCLFYLPILQARKIAREKPLGDLVDEESKAAYKKELSHLSKEELLEKMLAAFLRE